MKIMKIWAVIALLAVATTPAFGAPADLVHVTTHVSQPSASPGGANEGEVLIENITSSNVRVRMTCRVVWADGSVQQLSGIADPGTLAPGGGYIQSIYFIIPPDAPPGPASFIADVSAASGGLQEQETSTATFQVVIP
ncbi:MAG TPA: hypothetical protein VF266_07760 [Thermoanaerobaculia bacterium]